MSHFPWPQTRHAPAALVASHTAKMESSFAMMAGPVSQKRRARATASRKRAKNLEAKIRMNDFVFMKARSQRGVAR